jgi:hypothetical protein
MPQTIDLEALLRSRFHNRELEFLNAQQRFRDARTCVETESDSELLCQLAKYLLGRRGILYSRTSVEASLRIPTVEEIRAKYNATRLKNISAKQKGGKPLSPQDKGFLKKLRRQKEQ